MGKMARRPRLRAFRQEFLDFLSARGVLPKHATLKRWLEDRGCGARTQSLLDLLKGGYVEERLVAAVVEMFLRDGTPQDKGPLRRALDDYLGVKRAAYAAKLDVEAVAACICTAPSPANAPDSRRFAVRDFFGVGLSRLGAFAVEPLMRRCVRACLNDDEAREVAEWVCLLVGRMFEGEAASCLRATEAAARRMGVDLETYAERVVEWRKAAPWSVVRAVRRGVPIGAVIMLPVTEAAYDAVASGKRPSSDLRAGDLLPSSHRVIVEAVAERPTNDLKGRLNPSLYLFGCVAVQVAALLRHGAGHESVEYRLLSFGGTPVGRKRLADSGYRPTGIDMAGTSADLWERRCHGNGDGWSYPEFGFIAQGGRKLPATPPTA